MFRATGLNRMQVEMLVGLSGPTYTLDPGDRREFPQDEAVRLIEAGYAIPVSERQIERTVADPIIETRETSPEQQFQHRKHKKHRR